MPVMDGIAATMEIRKWEQERNSVTRVPIVALTANAMVEGMFLVGEVIRTDSDFVQTRTNVWRQEWMVTFPNQLKENTYFST